MTEISYFQQYSQKENHITNNTLLMFRHLYRHSPLRFEGLLKEIISDDIEIGLVFQQQIKADNSVPDGMISQKPLNLYIEAKADGALYADQIERHIQSIRGQKLDASNAIIIGLCKYSLSDAEQNIFNELCKENQINFSYVTYLELVQSLKKLCPDYEVDLTEIIEDYELFLTKEGMLPNPFNMVVFPCGTSWNENVAYRIYYEQATKPSKDHAPFIGIYNNKKITHIGKIRATAICSIKNGKLIAENEYNSLEDADEELIAEVIAKTGYYTLGKDAERFYLIDDLREVNITKKSSGGIRGHRYFDLRSFSQNISNDADIDAIAKLIRGASFE